MTYQLIDTLANKVLGVYETEAEARKFEQRMVHEPGEARYEIVAPTPPAKKKTTKVEEQEDDQEEGN